MRRGIPILRDPRSRQPPDKAEGLPLEQQAFERASEVAHGNDHANFNRNQGRVVSVALIFLIAAIAVVVFAALWPDFAKSHPYRGDE